MDYLIVWLNQFIDNPETASMAFIGGLGLAVFALGLSGMFVVGTLTDPTRRRVRQVAGDPVSSVGSAQNWLKKTLAPYYDRFVPKDKREQAKVEVSLIQAGYRRPGSLGSFYAVKVLLIIGLPLVVFLAGSWLPNFTLQDVTVAALVSSAVGLLGPNYVLGKQVEARQSRIKNGLPDALDLLVVCAEAGLGLKGAIQRVAEEVAVSHPELADELALVNMETRAGMDRTQALRNLAERTGVDELRGLVTLLIQSMRFGTSIADALRIYAAEFRDRRMQQAEENAAKIGTKMIFPLVLCLFPSFFLVAAGPAVVGVLAAFR